ncbi:MAG: STAS domain-containing protein [Chloroflexota bacterium]|jgi:anti-sigma B factor antagonist
MELKSRSAGHVKILELSGRFDTYTAEQVRPWIQKAVDEEPANIVVNLEGVDFVDSTGLATLVQGVKNCRQLNGDLRLCGVQQPVRMVFELTRLDKFFEIYLQEDEAVKSFAN